MLLSSLITLFLLLANFKCCFSFSIKPSTPKLKSKLSKQIITGGLVSASLTLLKVLPLYAAESIPLVEIQDSVQLTADSIVQSASTSARLGDIIVYIKDLYEALKDASTIDSVSSFIAIVSAEGIAGIVAAALSRILASLLQDRKRDNILTDLLDTGVFFSSRSFFRSLALLSGVPLPFSLVIASLLGSFFSEITKFAGRYYNESPPDSTPTSDGVSKSALSLPTSTSGDMEEKDMISNAEIYSGMHTYIHYTNHT